MRQLCQIVVIGVLLAALVSCGPAGVPGDGAGAPSTNTTTSPVGSAAGTGAGCTDPDIRGTITDIALNDNTITILVEGEQTADTSFDRASVTVTEQTSIMKHISEHERHQVTIDALERGANVEACFTGPVLESYPVQATASEVVILDFSR
jgi:hypothetical protein